MKRIYIILAASLIFEGIFSNFIRVQTMVWNPLFLLISLIVICPYLKNTKKYYKICFIYGILYDLIYTNTFFFHGVLFIIIGHLVIYLYKLFSPNIINLVIIITISIFIYRGISFILLCLLNNYYFSLITLFRSITSSLLSNIIYTIILYIFINKKYHLSK